MQPLDLARTACGVLAAFMLAFAGAPHAAAQERRALALPAQRLASDRIPSPFDFEGPILPRGLRFGILGGPCFDAEASSRSCHTGAIDLQYYFSRGDVANFVARSAALGRPLPALQSEETIFSARAALTVSNDTWPDKEPPDSALDSEAPNARVGLPTRAAHGAVAAAPPRVKHNGSFTATLEITLPIPVEPQFLVEPFAGGGRGLVRRDGPSGGRSTVEDTGFWVATYGLDVTMRTPWRLPLLRYQIDLRAQYRGLVYFPDEITYLFPNGTSAVVDDTKRVSSAALLFGLGLHL